MNEETIFSPCQKYRYTLWRRWAPGPVVQFVGLNPSTADETNNDPTVRRCIDFAKRWNAGALCMTNIFAWRDTDPEKMKRAVDPVGPDNDRWLLAVAEVAAERVAAWGNHGKHLDRSVHVKWLFAGANRPLHCLRLTGTGQPCHPLYLPATCTLIPL